MDAPLMMNILNLIQQMKETNITKNVLKKAFIKLPKKNMKKYIIFV